MLIKGPNDALLTQGFPWLFGGGALLGSGALGDWEVWLALRQIAAPITSSREDLMPSIHPEARTTPTVRVEIARSHNPTGVLAKTLWREHRDYRQVAQAGSRGLSGPYGRPHKLPWKATDEERAIVCALRQATGFPLDDLTFVVTHFLPR